MGRFSFVIGILVIAALGGCSSSTYDSSAPGPVDSGLYRAAVLDNQQRLAGEDHRVVPLYKTPFSAIGIGLDFIFIKPWVILFSPFNHNTLAAAVHQMEYAKTPDQERQGILWTAEFPHARQGIYIKGYAYKAKESADFTVRAAGLRALNRCRAQGYTSMFLDAINDDQSLIRVEAADALGNIPDPQAIPYLELHMTDTEPDLDVRIACTEALRNFHTTGVMRALVDELQDPEFSVAWQARQSLEMLTAQDFRYDQKAWLSYLAKGT